MDSFSVWGGRNSLKCKRRPAKIFLATHGVDVVFIGCIVAEKQLQRDLVPHGDVIALEDEAI